MSNQTEQLQNDLRLIQEVKKHTNLYDPRCKDKDSKSKEHTWSIIGKILNSARKYKSRFTTNRNVLKTLKPLLVSDLHCKPRQTADVCKNRWKNLRDKYTREKKLIMIEGEESYRSHSWPLLDEMSFLWNFVSHRNRPQLRLKNLSPMADRTKYPTPYDWIEASINYNDCDDNSVKSSFLDPACVLVEEDEPLEANQDFTASRSKLRRLLENKDDDNSDLPNGNLADSFYQPENQAEIRVPQPIHLMDEEEYFCMSLAASLRRLPKQTSSLLKIKIMQILYDVEFGEKKIE